MVFLSRPADSGLSGMDPLPVPYEIRRVLPTEWQLLPLLKGDVLLLSPGPARFLHASLDIQDIPGRGRGIVAKDALECGDLVMLDSPMLTAPTYDELVQETIKKCREDVEFRRSFFSMCGDPEDEEARKNTEKAPLPATTKNIIRHNYHGLDWAPVDGEIFDRGNIVGLWPLGSLLNHSIRPNIARSFAGHTACYRVIRPIASGEEVLDNYLDLRLPHEQRQEMMRVNHNMDDEGPDSCDAPAEAVKEIKEAEAKASTAASLGGSKQKAMKGFKLLLKLTQKAMSLEARDPCFHDLFRNFGLCAGQLGDAELSIQGLAQALELTQSREPYSVLSSILSARMLHMACLAADKIDEETRRRLEKLAREHSGIIYGSEPGIFEALNPGIMAMLQDIAAPNADAPTSSKRKRPETEDEPESKTCEAEDGQPDEPSSSAS